MYSNTSRMIERFIERFYTLKVCMILFQNYDILNDYSYWKMLIYRSKVSPNTYEVLIEFSFPLVR